MPTGLMQAERAAAGVNEPHSGDRFLREQLIASFLAAPVAAGLPVGAIYRAMQTLVVSPDEVLCAAHPHEEGAVPVLPG